MINEFQTTALGCIFAGALYDRSWRIVLKNSPVEAQGVG
jgi:hypothetical protein